MRTRSPSMIARGMTATSGRQLRSCEGAIVSPPRNHAEKHDERPVAGMRRVRDNQSAQIANTAKAAAQRQPQRGPRQVRIVDCQRGPDNEQGAA